MPVLGQKNVCVASHYKVTAVHIEGASSVEVRLQEHTPGTLELVSRKVMTVTLDLEDEL